MSLVYTSVQWNRQKRIYDTVLAAAVGGYLLLFVAVTKGLYPLVTDEILLIRASGTCAFGLLHVILCIGPWCRLNPRFLPWLYNRRHAGVTLALIALLHAVLVLATYHAGGDANPLLSVFTASPLDRSSAGLPFQAFGILGLVILLLMAATSHDFWLANLTAPVWKSLHMLVYVAYGLLVLHVTFGALQAEHHPLYVAATAVGLTLVLGLHLAAARRETTPDRPIDPLPATPTPPAPSPAATGFVEVCAVDDIPENRARTVCLAGERVAIFRYGDRVSAVSNVCQHQNGPLGEGRIVDGCITCPWHGYQYDPDTGAAPAPFVEKVPTFATRVEAGRVWVHPRPHPPGTSPSTTRVQPSLP